MFHQNLQQNLNQITQICHQLSQNEQMNVSKLSQMQDAERLAAQQLQQCAQLANQVSQQIQQIMSSQQFSSQQFGTSLGTNYGANYGASYVTPNVGSFQGSSTSSWANRPINTNVYTPTTSQYGFAGQTSGIGKYEMAQEFKPTGPAAFNTNKDLGQ